MSSFFIKNLFMVYFLSIEIITHDVFGTSGIVPVYFSSIIVGPYKKSFADTDFHRKQLHFVLVFHFLSALLCPESLMQKV